MVRYSGNDDEMLVHLALIITWRSGSEWRQFTCKRATRWCRGFNSRPSLWLTASAKPTAAQQAWWSVCAHDASSRPRPKKIVEADSDWPACVEYFCVNSAETDSRWSESVHSLYTTTDWPVLTGGNVGD